MATKTKKKRYTEEEKQKHVKATKGFKHGLMKEYADERGLSVHTLRGWHNNLSGKSKKSSKGPGRPKGSKNKKSSKGPGRPKGSKNKGGRKSGPKPKSTRGRRALPPSNGTVKSRISSFLKDELQDRLDNGPSEDTVRSEAVTLLEDVYATL